MRENAMLKFSVRNSMDNTYRIMTERQIENEHLDLRIYEILPIRAYRKMMGIDPIFTIAVRVYKNNRWKDKIVPVTSPSMLNGIYISKSGHFLPKDTWE